MKNILRLSFLTSILQPNSVYADTFCNEELGSTLSNDNRFSLSMFVGEALGQKFSGENYTIHKKPKSSNTYSIGIGYSFNDKFRGEIAVASFRGFDYKADYTESHIIAGDVVKVDWQYKQNIKSNTVAINLHHDLRNIHNITPYISGGIGMAIVKAGIFDAIGLHDENVGNPPILFDSYDLPCKTQHNFMWNIGAGISYKVSDFITWDVVNYRYYDLGRATTEDGKKEGGVVPAVKTKLSAHSITTGIRMNF